jgi:hypothetical protein
MLGVARWEERPMPSTSRASSGARPGGRRITPRSERALADLGDSLKGQVQRLVAGRQHLYDSVQLHRQSGQVIHTTLCEALDENALRLRDALVRYIETTQR